MCENNIQPRKRARYTIDSIIQKDTIDVSRLLRDIVIMHNLSLGKGTAYYNENGFGMEEHRNLIVGGTIRSYIIKKRAGLFSSAMVLEEQDEYYTIDDTSLYSKYFYKGNSRTDNQCFEEFMEAYDIKLKKETENYFISPHSDVWKKTQYKPSDKIFALERVLKTQYRYDKNAMSIALQNKKDLLQALYSTIKQDISILENNETVKALIAQIDQLDKISEDRDRSYYINRAEPMEISREGFIFKYDFIFNKKISRSSKSILFEELGKKPMDDINKRVALMFVIIKYFMIVQGYEGDVLSLAIEKNNIGLYSTIPSFSLDSSFIYNYEKNLSNW